MTDEFEVRWEHLSTQPHPSIRYWAPVAEHGRAKDEKGATAIIIFPGGGYRGLAEHEGAGYAEHFSKLGYACFVVRYRVNPDGAQHPAMLEDALTAVSMIRAQAERYGVDPSRIGVMGSSAGGHLAAHASVGWKFYREEFPVSPRPDFTILCYPVILTTGSFAHSGSVRNLLGDHISAERLREISILENLDAEAPPCFVWHTVEDQAVPIQNSIALVEKLAAYGVSFEAHFYPKGRHGLGLNAPYPWADACHRWLSSLF